MWSKEEDYEKAGNYLASLDGADHGLDNLTPDELTDYLKKSDQALAKHKIWLQVQASKKEGCI